MILSPISVAERVKRADKVLIIGNGGSYANASHICNDFLACGIRAFTLDAASLTASANDYGYESVFSRWVAAVGECGDLLIALSGSGKSKNIVAAIEEAQARGMDWFLVTDYLQTRDMQQSEEDQIVLGHEVMRLLRDAH